MLDHAPCIKRRRLLSSNVERLERTACTAPGDVQREGLSCSREGCHFVLGACRRLWTTSKESGAGSSMERTGRWR